MKFVFILVFAIFSLWLSSVLINSANITNYFRPSVIRYETLSPSDTFFSYWQLIKSGQREKSDQLITIAPMSLWDVCAEQDISKIDPTASNLIEDEEVLKNWQRGFIPFMHETADYIQITHINTPEIEETRVFGNEALIKIKVKSRGPEKNADIYLSKDDNQWKIFFIDFFREQTNLNFAQKRPPCK